MYSLDSKIASRGYHCIAILLGKMQNWRQVGNGNRDKYVIEINRPMRLCHQEKAPTLWQLVDCGTYSKRNVTPLLFLYVRRG